MDQDLSINIVYTSEKTSNEKKDKNSVHEIKPSTSSDEPKKRLRAVHEKSSSINNHKKSSALFTKLQEVTIPEGLSKEKKDFSVTNAPSKHNLFSSFDLNPFLVKSLNKLSFENPTKIQQAVIPHLLQSSHKKDHDVIIQAQTGSGKTLSYVLPILNDLLQTENDDRSVGTLCLLIVPTRELCQQVYDTFYSILYPKNKERPNDDDDEVDKSDDDKKKRSKKYRWIVPSILCGGQSKKSEKARLRKGVTVLIATPGRLLDHMKSTACLNLSKLRWMVMDEADRFEEMGMKEPMTEIQQELNRLCSEKHATILCSATVSSKTSELGGVKLNDPILLSANVLEKSENLEMLPNQVKTIFVTVPAKIRLVTLTALLETISNRSKDSKTIVFFSNCATVDYFHDLLSQRFDKVYKLHGSIEHEKRKETIKLFHERGILLTTDLGARGLDFPRVQTIVQFDIPNDTMACVHRIGRTARCGSSGNAYIFVMPHEIGWIDYMKDLIDGSIVSYETLFNDLNKLLKVRDIRVELSKWQKTFEDYALKNTKKAKEAFMASVKAYATHPKDIRNALCVKSLHLGHYAKSFALKDAPSQMMVAKKKDKRKKIDYGSLDEIKSKRSKLGSLDVSEFAAS